MKVYIICKEPFPYGMAATQRIICYAKALMSEYLDCEILVYSRQEKGRIRRNQFSKGYFEGIPFRYVGGSTRKPSHKIARLICERYDKMALRVYLSRNLSPGDIVIAYVNSDIDYLCNIINLVHSKGAKYVRELNEIPFFGGESKEEKEGLKKILDTLFPKCDGFITISDTLTELVKKHCRPDAPIIKIPILVDFQKANVPDCSDQAEVPFILHTGTLYERKDGIIGMINAFAMARKQLGGPFRLLMTGNLETSPDKEAIRNAIDENNISDSVEFLGYLHQEEITNLLSESLFAVMNKKDNVQNNNGFSTKIGGYLAAGKALIITDVGEAMNWLKDGRDAWIVPRDNTGAMADAIVKAFTDIEERKRIGENGRALCRECFDWHNISGRLTSFLKSL